MNRSPPENPLEPILAEQGTILLDGGLATELEARGCDLNDSLWSAKVLVENPGIIRDVHLDYLAAGADCIIASSYQASPRGFEERGYSSTEAADLLGSSVSIAVDARDDFWGDPSNRVGRMRPLVAASVGPYGAYLADGSEYTGDYGVDEGFLRAFHGPRWRVLAESGADLLACETIPSRVEASVLLSLLRNAPNATAWFSFTCRDERHVSDGSVLAEVAGELAAQPQVVAIGVNCTSPRFIPQLISQLRQVTDKPIVVYPNSGERFDAASRGWVTGDDQVDFGTACLEWRDRGARLIGGCCRTGPEHVRVMRERLLANGD